jgi:hypothetical protein
MHIDSGSQIALVVYMLIVARWFYVINRYHGEVLAMDTSYTHKHHPVFKAILFGRAIGLAAVAPLFALVKPDYFSQFFDGIKTK